MIIFDLSCLADDSHRLHFVNPKKFLETFMDSPNFQDKNWLNRKLIGWEPDWRAFYDACDGDAPTEAVSKIFDDLAVDNEIQIWSCTCESVRSKLQNWLYNYIPYSSQELKMRPIGDDRPQEQLFEEWLNKEVMLGPFQNITCIDMVFSSHKETIDMFTRRGIPCFQFIKGDS